MAHPIRRLTSQGTRHSRRAWRNPTRPRCVEPIYKGLLRRAEAPAAAADQDAVRAAAMAAYLREQAAPFLVWHAMRAEDLPPHSGCGRGGWGGAGVAEGGLD